MSKQYAILLAAGKGTRYRDVKQDLVFHGKEIWRYPYDLLVSILGADHVVVVGKDVPGGDTRTASVLSGLKALPSTAERVIIVEAARPMVTETQVRELLEDGHPSTSFVRPLVNTVIYRDGTYINRNELYDLRVCTGHRYDGGVSAFLDAVVDMIAARGLPR